MAAILTSISRIKNILVLYFCLIVLTGYTQNPATLTGIVTNCATGAPVIGALVSTGSLSTYSVSGGIYTLSISPAGTYTITYTKTGFVTYVSNPVFFGTGLIVNLPVCLNAIANPPAQVVASLDSAHSPPVVNISWQFPRGDYELLYDDGIMDNFTIWTTGGNMNAVKFTPLGYPVTITGGKINIGTQSNYPIGSTPFVPFQVSVYDASGSGGTPGVLIAGPVNVVPSDFGWVDFSVPSQPVINSGNFYLVMIQGGNAPDAAGLAIDLTNPQSRSYSRLVTTGPGPWIPAAGNFMMRALVNGPGGPPQSYVPANVTAYTVSRLLQGEEQNQQVWTQLGQVTSTQITDPSWPSLPCGPYRWAARAIYTGNQFSGFSFSNVIGKCWTVNITVITHLSCDSSSKTGIAVSLKNLVYPDTLYTRMADTTGSAFFPGSWKGTYELKVTRFGYQDFIQDLSISTDTILQVWLHQKKAPPTGLFVNDSNLVAHWNKPSGSVELLNETWQSGSFITNGWTAEGPNWNISTVIGEPIPSAMFYYSPHAMNYEQSLISKPITGQNSSVLRLKYDIFLNNFGTTTLNQMAVELWDGSSWHMLRNYTNSQGDIPWTSQDLDISAYSAITFKIRFRAYGIDSDDINNWNIDNIVVEAKESQSTAGECVLAYNFYINNILCGVTTDTLFQVPPSIVQFGASFTACVGALYGSGISALDCYPFVSGYLPPPTNLQGTNIVSTAYLSWNNPVSKAKVPSFPTSTPPGLKGYIIYRNGIIIDSVKNADTLHYNDTGLYPGTYNYKVASFYDLTSYGYPGLYSQSYPAGPVTVNIIYGHLLPFTEPWDQATFTYNNWSFDPAKGNWSISNTFGNPAPSAQFSADPPITNYSTSLVSEVIDATETPCANIWLDFDYRLIDHNATGKEKLDVEIFYDNIWHGLAEFSNKGSTLWISDHLDISPVKGNAFTIRFRASGLNSLDLSQWNIDNINVYAVCKPPEDLVAEPSGQNILLTWSPPVCEDGYPLNEGFEEQTFPPVNWTRIITNINNVTWEQTNITSKLGVHSGLHAAGVTWDYSHQDEWLIAQNVQVTGDLTFWSYAFQGSTHLDHYYVKISEDQGAHWQSLLDMSALPPYPSPTGYNTWSQPYTVSLSSYLGQVDDIAWQAVDGDGQGLWYPWSIDDCSVGSKKLLLPGSTNSTEGYSVFRKVDGGIFNLLTQGPVYDTTWLDQGLATSAYRYYVTAFNTDCSSHTSSDTVLVNLVVGIPSPPDQFLKLFPNPAHDIVTIRSTAEIIGIEVFDYLGQKMVTKPGISTKEFNVSVSDFRQGVYFFRIKTETSVQTFKVSVVR